MHCAGAPARARTRMHVRDAGWADARDCDECATDFDRYDPRPTSKIFNQTRMTSGLGINALTAVCMYLPNIENIDHCRPNSHVFVQT